MFHDHRASVKKNFKRTTNEKYIIKAGQYAPAL